MKRRKVIKSLKHLCSRKFVHIWECIQEYNTHKMYECSRCHGHRWVDTKD